MYGQVDRTVKFIFLIISLNQICTYMWAHFKTVDFDLVEKLYYSQMAVYKYTIDILAHTHHIIYYSYNVIWRKCCAPILFCRNAKIVILLHIKCPSTKKYISECVSVRVYVCLYTKIQSTNIPFKMYIAYFVRNRVFMVGVIIIWVCVFVGRYFFFLLFWNTYTHISCVFILSIMATDLRHCCCSHHTVPQNTPITPHQCKCARMKEK